MFSTKKFVQQLLAKNSANSPSHFVQARTFIELKVELREMLEDIFLILLGVCSAAFALESFLLPNGFIDGGATGISLIISVTSNVSLALLILLVNIPFVILAYTTIGKGFAVKTVFAIVMLAAVVYFFPFPVATTDKLLVSVFGGFFLGLGIGLSVRGGAVIDGTEVLAIAISRKSGMSIGDVILSVNVVIFGVAAWLLGVETALYAMLTYLAASKTVDFIIEGIEEYTGVTIISVKSERIMEVIIEKMGRGITVYKGERGHGKSVKNFRNMNIVYTIVTRLEVNRLKTEIEKIDPNAFVVMTSVKDMKGGMIKKRRLH